MCDRMRSFDPIMKITLPGAGTGGNSFCLRSVERVGTVLRDDTGRCHCTSMSKRQWSLGPHLSSSASLSAHTRIESAMLRDAKT